MVPQGGAHPGLRGRDQSPRRGRRVGAGADAHVDLPGARQHSYLGVRRFRHDGADAVIHRAFAQLSHLQHAAMDHLVEVPAAAQVGHHLVLHQPLHLERHARQADHGAALILDDECRSGAVGIGHQGSAPWQQRLLLVVRGEHESARAEPLLQVAQRAGVALQGSPEYPRHRLAGEIVLGGPQPAAGDHAVRPLQGALEHVRHTLQVVAHGSLAKQVSAYLGQTLSHPRRVAVTICPSSSSEPIATSSTVTRPSSRMHRPVSLRDRQAQLWGTTKRRGGGAGLTSSRGGRRSRCRWLGGYAAGGGTGRRGYRFRLPPAPSSSPRSAPRCRPGCRSFPQHRARAATGARQGSRETAGPTPTTSSRS